MIGRVLFFVLGGLIGAAFVFFFVPMRYDVSIVPVALIPAPVTQAPNLVTPQITVPAPASPPVTGVPAPLPTPVPSSTLAPAPVTTPTEPASPISNLLLPVLGIKPGELVDTYYQTRGGTLIHEALDIMAPRGREVVAVADGKIAKLFTSKPGGLTVYQFDMTERFAYYYAHLDRYAAGIAEGKVLKRGELIGYVGSSGDANPDAPHLHFAIFELGPQKRWWEGKPINPYPLLRGSTGG
jgi:murein DD-endopeptidase MepM/ murein hydrolase activator NlpD